MATRKPLVIVSGRIKEQPEGDSPAGAEPAIAAPVSAPTEKYWRGDKTWRDFFTDVRAATLTGLSTATNAVVAATDTVLAAIGKLQAQVSTKYDKTGGDVDGNINITGGGRLIQADLSSATRAKVKTNVLNGVTLLTCTPNGTANTTTVDLFDKDDIENGAYTRHFMYGGLYGGLAVGKTGSGGYLPMGFEVGGVLRLRIDPTTGNVLATSGAIGYGVGAGGTVTQATSKSTTVMLNKPTGAITMNNASLGAGESVVFSVKCPFFAVEDAVYAQQVGSNSYRVETYTSSGAVFGIRVTNVTGIARAEALKIRFVILKGA